MKNNPKVDTPTQWLERYSPNQLWREELRYREGILVRYCLGRRSHPDSIVWSIFVTLDRSLMTEYLFDALVLHDDWTTEDANVKQEPEG